MYFHPLTTNYLFKFVIHYCTVAAVVVLFQLTTRTMHFLYYNFLKFFTKPVLVFSDIGLLFFKPKTCHQKPLLGTTWYTFCSVLLIITYKNFKQHLKKYFCVILLYCAFFLFVLHTFYMWLRSCNFYFNVITMGEVCTVVFTYMTTRISKYFVKYKYLHSLHRQSMIQDPSYDNERQYYGVKNLTFGKSLNKKKVFNFATIIYLKLHAKTFSHFLEQTLIYLYTQFCIRSQFYIWFCILHLLCSFSNFLFQTYWKELHEKEKAKLFVFFHS